MSQYKRNQIEEAISRTFGDSEPYKRYLANDSANLTFEITLTSAYFRVGRIPDAPGRK